MILARLEPGAEPLEEALAIYAHPKQRGRAAADPGKDLGKDLLEELKKRLEEQGAVVELK